MIYLSDMSRCRPDSALSDRLEKDSWTLISYETEEVSGTLVSFICQEGVNSEDLKCCKRHGCRFILFPGYRPPTPTTPKTVVEGYRKGVDGFAIWDINADYPEAWEWYRRIGHRVEMETWDKHVSECRRIPLVTLGGFNVEQGLQASVYSGG